MVDTQEPPSVREHEQLVRMGLWVVIGVAVVMVLAAVVVFTHRSHTPELVPGQKQPSAIAWLDFRQPS
jgi:hypothetical protein